MMFKDAKRTNFVVGQTVEVVDNSGMCASIGATAIVEDINEIFLIVKWKTSSKTQMDGAYFLHHFKPKFVRDEQLLFAFMD